MNPIYASRRRNDIIIRFLCLGAALFGVTWLALILFTLFYNGLAGISVQLFTQNTPPPGSSEGGLLNAIVGSVIMTVIGVGIGAPLGLFAGTYLAEYGRNDRLTSVIRFINDILLSAPSIIIGLFIYEVMVLRMGHFSAWAGATALALDDRRSVGAQTEVRKQQRDVGRGVRRRRKRASERGVRRKESPTEDALPAAAGAVLGDEQREQAHAKPRDEHRELRLERCRRAVAQIFEVRAEHRHRHRARARGEAAMDIVELAIADGLRAIRRDGEFLDDAFLRAKDG